MLLSFKDKSYYIPKDWSEVRVRHFKEILAIKPELIGGDNRLYDLSLLAVFTGLSIDELKEIPFDMMEEVKDTLSFLHITPPSNEMKFIFNISGQTWGFDSDLVKLQYGQFIDMEGLVEKNKQLLSEHDSKHWNGIEHWKYIGELLAIVIRPTVNKKNRFSIQKRLFNKKLRGVYKYTLEPYDATKSKLYAEMLEDQLSVNDANGIALFFYHFATESMRIISDYSQEQLVDMQMKEQKNLEKSGTGMEPSTL